MSIFCRCDRCGEESKTKAAPDLSVSYGMSIQAQGIGQMGQVATGSARLVPDKPWWKEVYGKQLCAPCVVDLDRFLEPLPRCAEPIL